VEAIDTTVAGGRPAGAAGARSGRQASTARTFVLRRRASSAAQRNAAGDPVLGLTPTTIGPSGRVTTTPRQAPG
jgi:hypothetical protein